jgi:hypothetical protein
MKQIVFLILLSILSFNSEAQIDLYANTAGTITTDSLLNSVTSNLTTASAALNSIGKGGNYVVQWTAYNDSATTSIKAILQGSIDGVHFDNLFGTVGTNGINCDTFSTGSVTSSDSITHRWTIKAGSFKDATLVIRNGSVLDSVYTRNNYLVPTNAGRVLWLRVKQVQAAGGKSRSKAKALATD